MRKRGKEHSTGNLDDPGGQEDRQYNQSSKLPDEYEKEGEQKLNLQNNYQQNKNTNYHNKREGDNNDYNGSNKNAGKRYGNNSNRNYGNDYYERKDNNNQNYQKHQNNNRGGGGGYHNKSHYNNYDYYDKREIGTGQNVKPQSERVASDNNNNQRNDDKREVEKGEYEDKNYNKNRNSYQNNNQGRGYHDKNYDKNYNKNYDKNYDKNYNNNDYHQNQNNRREDYDQGNQGNQGNQGKPQNQNRKGGLQPYRKKDSSKQDNPSNTLNPKSSNQNHNNNPQNNSKRNIKKSPDVQKDLGTECIICLTKVYMKSAVWYCKCCWIDCHLNCIKQWICKQNNIKDRNEAKNLKNFSFSCPHCNSMYSLTQMPKYLCYCGKTKDPEFDTYLDPHTCELICGKKRGEDCTHPCPKNCHKGACPPCNIQSDPKRCYCGQRMIVKPCSDTDLSCQNTCNKLLKCKKHYCQKLCHDGECQDCDETQEMKCFCERETKEVQCGTTWNCARTCNAKKNCNNCNCSLICHEGPHELCKNKPIKFETCFCGKKAVKDLIGRERESCLDPKVSCKKICDAK